LWSSFSVGSILVIDDEKLVFDNMHHLDILQCRFIEYNE